MPEAGRQELSIRDYVGLLLRRKWIVLAAIVVAPVCAVAIAMHQHPIYEATATVATKEGDLAATVSGVPDTSFDADPDRLAQTQILLAETPDVATKVLSRAGVKTLTPDGLLGETVIVADPSADALFFTVKDGDSQRAAVLANAWAKQYTILRSQTDTQSLRQARTDVLKRAAELDAQGRKSYASSLVSKAEQLQTLVELEETNAVVANTAQGAAKISPRPKRDGAFGLAIGIVLGIGLAFLRDALDTRVRAADDVARRTGMLLLARLPELPRKLQRSNELVMFSQPASVAAEGFRMLRTNVDFANLEHEGQSIMVTSALEKEGKSTTVANLAIVEARAGKRVVLVDLDLRRPRIDKFFQLGGRPGLTNVILGHCSLEEATTRVSIEGEKRILEVNEDDRGALSVLLSGSGNGHVPVEGVLDVIPTGPIPPDPGELVATAALARLLASLSARYDLVLIDAPPLLRVGDALTLASSVSALLVVMRLSSMRRPVLSELRRVLEACPTRVLGFVLTGVKAEESYSRGYYYDYREREQARERAEQRVR